MGEKIIFLCILLGNSELTTSSSISVVHTTLSEAVAVSAACSKTGQPYIKLKPTE